MSYYEGLSSKLEKRFASGISFLSTFTYGHSLDFQNSALDLCDGCGSSDTIQNNYNRFANKASSDNDVRVRFVMAGSFESPFGKGRKYLSQSRAGSALLGGWRLSLIYQTQSGLPFTPAISFDAANAGTTTRPNRVCDGNTSGGRSINTSIRPLRTSPVLRTCSAIPDEMFCGRPISIILTSACSAISACRSNTPPSCSSASKGFNALNHPQFSAPGATVGTSAYGVITATSQDNRQLQFGVRVSF